MDKKNLHKFVKTVGEKLKGRWILIGGAVLPFLNIEYRITEDIDIVGSQRSTQEDYLTLMKIAEELGLPIEAINQAASFFLYKIPHWDSELVLLHRGSHAEIYRPSATLFILLKIQRLTEVDLEDCLRVLKFALKKKESVDYERIIDEINRQIKMKPQSLKLKRLKILKNIMIEKNVQ